MSSFISFLNSMQPSPLQEAIASAYSALFEDTETNIAKNPEGYGLHYLQQKYSEFRNRFFNGDNGYLPPKMDIGFSNTLRALGHCATREREFLGKHDVIQCAIKLSNAFDFTPKKLDEVLLHEMIHAYLKFSPNPADYKETHGTRFLVWCNRINSSSDYNITVTNDTPMTLNNGMANRIANDSTILVIARDTEPGKSMVSRIRKNDTDWAIPRIKNWLNTDVKCYACSDANFKRDLTIAKTRLTARSYPNSTIDEMIDAGILKEIHIAEGAPQKGVLLAWPWYNNMVGYSLVEPSIVPTVINLVSGHLEDHGMENRISMYHLNKFFTAWSKPAVKSMTRGLPNMSMPKDEFNDLVRDGTLDYLRDITR